MAKLYDYRLKAGVLVADERVNELVSSGNYSFIKGDTIHVTDEAGQIYNVPAENAQESLDLGYTFAPKEVVDDARMRQEIEDSPGTSFGYGLARSLTFGLSDALGNEKELQARREISPIPTGIGEIGGILTPVGLTGLAARGATKAASALLKSASTAAANSKRLKTVGSVLNSRVVKGAVGGAAEGYAVGTMYGVSEQLLDDPENYPTFTDHIYAGAGFGLEGAAFGFAGGGIISAIGASLKGAGGKFKKEAHKAYFRALDPRRKDYDRVTRKNAFPENVTNLGQRIKELDDKGILKNLDDAVELENEISKTLLPEYGQKIDDLIGEVEKAVKASGQSMDDVQFNINKIAKKQQFGLQGMPQETSIVNKIKRAKKSIKAFRDLAKGNETLTFRESERLKTWYQKNLANYQKEPLDYDYFNVMAGIIRDESEKALEAISGKLSTVKGFSQKTYAEFLEAKQIYGSLKQIRDVAAEASARQMINNRLPLTSYLTASALSGGVIASADSVLTGGLGAAATFAGTALLRKYAKDNGELILARTMGSLSDYGNLLNFAGKSQTTINKYVKTLVRGGGAAITTKIANPLPDTPKKTVEKYKKLKKDIEEINTNPESLFVRLDAMLPDVEGDQTINRELAQTMANVVGFLNEKLPGNTTGSQLLFNKDQVPPMNQILKFMRYADVLNDPNKVLKLMIGGQLMPEHMEALTSVFPRLHQAQKEALLDGLTTEGLPIKMNLQQRQSVGRFLDTPTDRIFSSGFTERTQGAYAKAKEQAANQKGMNIKLPNYNTAIADVAALG
jgi:hypothetical protein